MITWKTCEAANCGKEFYITELDLDRTLCMECLEALALVMQANFGAPTMTIDEYQQLVEDYFNDDE